MADDKDQNSNDDFDALDEDFELDLFADDEASESEADSGGQKVEPQLSADEPEFDIDLDDELDSELLDSSDDDFEEDFADTLDADVIEISDEEVAEEFAAMERELAPPGPEPESPAEVTETGSSDDKADDSDDLYKNFTREEFGAPDQYNSETDLISKTDKPETRQATTREPAMALPAILAPLASLSPRMIVAATAAVLLPVVIFTVLGFNSDSSDADENSDSASSQIDTETTPFLETASIEQETEAEVEVPDLGSEQSDAALPGLTAQTAALEETSEDAVSLIDDNELQAPLATEVEPEAVDEQLLAEPEQDKLLLAQADTQPQTEEALENLDATADETGQGSEPEAEPEPATEALGVAVQTVDNSIPGTEQGRNYHVIVASFVSQAVAGQHAESISDNEITAYVIPPFGGSGNYRVAVANYRSMNEARENIPGLRAIYGNGIWPLRYPPSAGVPLISERSGNTYIIVASFPNEALARTHADSLVERGEQPAIIAPYPPSNRYRVAVSFYDSTSNAESALAQFRENYGEDAWLLRY